MQNFRVLSWQPIFLLLTIAHSRFQLQGSVKSTGDENGCQIGRWEALTTKLDSEHKQGEPTQT